MNEIGDTMTPSINNYLFFELLNVNFFLLLGSRFQFYGVLFGLGFDFFQLVLELPDRLVLFADFCMTLRLCPFQETFQLMDFL